MTVRSPERKTSQDLNSGYASFFNRRHRRCGALFQGRFKAVLVEGESHALELTRYVHLSAVRAKMVERPEEYDWSSYQDYLGLRKAPAWLDWETVIGELGKDRRRGRAAYRRFVEAGMCEPSQSPLEAAVVTDEAVGAIGEYFGGVSTAAISKTIARAETRRREDRAWDRLPAKLSERLRSGDST